MQLYESRLISTKLLVNNTGQIEGVPKNPRIIKTKAYEKLRDSIESDYSHLYTNELKVYAFGDKFVVISGNMRLKACKELKLKEIPCKIIPETWTAEQICKEAIISNVSSGEWNNEDLANEWDSLPLNAWGLDAPEWSEQSEPTAEEDDYEEPENLQVDVVLGDLIEFVCTDGRIHRLICGDSTDSDTVARLMNGEKADMAHNDPPYGMKKEKEGVLNDNLNFNDLLDFNREWISLQFMHLKDNGSWYCWGIDEPLMDIYSHILKPYIKIQKATFRNLITWDKGVGQGQNSADYRMYPIADEKCLFVMLGVQGFNNNADNYFEGWEPIRKYLFESCEKANIKSKKFHEILGVASNGGGMYSHHISATGSQWMLITQENYKKLQSYCLQNNIDAFKKEYDELKKEYDELKKEYYSTRAYFNNTHDNQNNVWHFERTSNNERETTGGHATPKPIPLCQRAIKSSCPDNGLAIDFFLGSGSTMVAAHQLNRKCYGMELDPKYCQVIIDRMTKLDSSINVFINGNRYIKKEGETPF